MNTWYLILVYVCCVLVIVENNIGWLVCYMLFVIGWCYVVHCLGLKSCYVLVVQLLRRCDLIWLRGCDRLNCMSLVVVAHYTSMSLWKRQYWVISWRLFACPKPTAGMGFESLPPIWSFGDGYLVLELDNRLAGNDNKFGTTCILHWVTLESHVSVWIVDDVWFMWYDYVDMNWWICIYVDFGDNMWICA